jgi:type IV pilus assembly protein PilB
MSSLKDRLTEILIKNNLITQQQLAQAIDVQKTKGGKLSDIIIELKFIKESDLISALSEGLNFPPDRPEAFQARSRDSQTDTANIARHYNIIPVSKIGDTVTLAMADPLNVFAIDHVGQLTGYRINPIVSSSSDILQALKPSIPRIHRN